MSDPVGVSQKSSRGAGNKGKLIGAKPPLSPRHVWSIRTRMQLEGRIRDNHRIVLGEPRQYADPSNTRRFLRAGHQWPRYHSSSENHQEFSPLHLIPRRKRETRRRYQF